MSIALIANLACLFPVFELILSLSPIQSRGSRPAEIQFKEAWPI